MTKKCKICGYRFKSKDEVICPECFTARDDNLDCNRYTDDLHSHAYGFDAEKSRFESSKNDNDIFDEYKNESFVEEQREDEKENPIPDSTFNKDQLEAQRKKYEDQYQSTRQQKLDALKNAASNIPNSAQPYVHIKSSYNGGKSTLRWTTGTATDDDKTYVNVNNNYTQMQNRKSSRGCLVAIGVFMIVMFLMPTIFGIIIALVDNSDDVYDFTDDDDDYSYSYSFSGIDMPDVTVPDADRFMAVDYESEDGSFTATVCDGVKYSTLIDINTASQNTNVTLYDDDVRNEKWTFRTFDLFIDSVDDTHTLLIDGARADFYDVQDNLIASCSIIDSVPQSDGYSMCSILVPENVFKMYVTVPVNVDSGDNEDALFELYAWNFASEGSDSEN